MDNTILEHIADSIKNGYSSGYAPFWELSFGEYYRTWQISDKNKKLIIEAILKKETSGEIEEIVDKKSVKIQWNLAFENE